MKYIYLSIYFAAFSISLHAQVKKKVLFIGNSYVYVNNLPQVLTDLALSLGDTVQYDSSAPGGHTFQNHCSNITTLAKIKSQNWDVVVLQAQSQEPSSPPSQVMSGTYPYAGRLADSIRKYNPCAEILFYMTWGRQNGDASNCSFYTPLCTYDGMQTRLRQSYMLFKDSFMTAVAPVGVTWKKIRTTNPSINLYDPDESHPSLPGTYLAASVFYSSIFLKSCNSSTYTAGINATDATAIRVTSSTTVLDSIPLWNLKSTVVVPQFTYTSVGNNTYAFQNTSKNANHYSWSFGSTQKSPTHSFNGNPPYTVKLVARNNCKKDSLQMMLGTATSVSVLESKETMTIYPNPFVDVVSITSEDEIRQITVTNQLGETIFIKNFETSTVFKYDLRLASIKAGIYYVTIQSKNNSFYKKILKD